MQINQYYPGIQGVGFSKQILPSEKAAHLRQIRGEGFPQYTIKPDGERPEYTSIIFLEPFDWRNQRAFGYDMFSEPTRKEAMIRARDTGIAALSGKVILVQETVKDIQAGFLIYLAIYRKGEPLETPEQRRKALMGYVYSPFRMNDFIKDILAEKQGYVYLQIFDGDKPLKETLLYRSDTAEEPHNDPESRHFATHQSILEYAGHRWLLSFVSSKYFEENIETGLTTFSLLLGITVSLLLFGMVLSFSRSRNQVIALANTTLDLEKANIGLRKEITERKRAEVALRESEERFRTAFENAATGMALMANDGYFLEVNQTLCKILGYSEEELLSKTWVEITEPEDLDGCYDWLKRIKTGEESAHEKRFIHKLGHQVWVMVSSSLVRDSQRKIRYYISLFQDIMSRKQAEEALRGSEEKYRSVVENANEGITVTQDGILKFVNRKGLKISGYSEEELLSRPFIEILHPDDQQVVMQHHLKRLKGEEIPMVYVLRIIAKDGAIKWLENNGVIITWEGNPATLNFFTDITGRKKMEEELLRAQKLESVGLLAGGIAHDFNNILTTILGNVSMAKMQVTPEGDTFEMLSEAEKASIRAQKLTKQLLTFAKGGAPLKETASIKNILKESSSFVLRGSKSRCELSMAEDLWPAEVDIGQISQVISNIVINANQAMPTGGIIQVTAENLIIDSGDGLPFKSGRYIRISIKDQGVGIAENHLSKVFDPYFTTKQEGNGLGLATAYSIIKKHDGHITVISRPEVGTTFHIYLPASEKAVPEKEKTRRIKGHGRILVMDDEASLRKIVGKMLAMLGYESEFAKDWR